MTTSSSIVTSNQNSQIAGVSPKTPSNTEAVEPQAKKQWRTPHLVTHGQLERLTLQLGGGSGLNCTDPTDPTTCT